MIFVSIEPQLLDSNWKSDTQKIYISGSLALWMLQMHKCFMVKKK
jgi:hypothetical protein